MPFFNSTEKNTDYNLVHEIPKRSAISVSLKIKKGSLCTRLFLLNKLKILKK